MVQGTAASKQEAALERLQSTHSYSTRYSKAYAAVRKNAQRSNDPPGARPTLRSNTLAFLGRIRQRKMSQQRTSTARPAQPVTTYLGHAHSPDPKVCIAPIPRTLDPSLYTRFQKTKRKNTHASNLLKQHKQHVFRAARWREYVDNPGIKPPIISKPQSLTQLPFTDNDAKYKLLDVSWEDLQNRSDDKASFDEAVITAEALRHPSIPEDSRSGLWNDTNDKPLLAYFGDRVYNGELISDGAKDRMVRRKHFTTQTLFHEQPKPFFKETDMTDQRHRDNPHVMKYFAEEEDGPLHETRGLRHDCLWSARGNSRKGLLPSKDTHSTTATGAVTAQSLVYADDDLTGLLREMVKVAFPEEFLALESSFAAGSWISSPLEPGPGGFKFPLPGGVFLGRATLWKLQTRLHMDTKDYLCAIVCSGEFEGGKLLLPDLGKKFSYRPGHVAIFRSNCLYHEVTEWMPKIMKRGDPFTPGRVAYTYFTHKDAVETLKDKPMGWYKATAGGKFSIGVELPMQSQ